mgnify:CR=1 FL=1
MRIGFDNEKYLKMQSEHIRNRIGKFGNKLYLEFGGKLFDDYHASRVLPGFAPDSKLRLLKELSSQAEIVIVISAKDIEKNKIRGDLGITYEHRCSPSDSDIQGSGIICRKCYNHSIFRSGKCPPVQKTDLKSCIFRYIFNYLIPGYPSNIPLINQRRRLWKKMIISRQAEPLVIVTAPGPEAGKMAA